ncbi:MAG: DUF975 family protein [Firmicutes bacterium]|nr:DUF975 family protein [Bacillota bacterium]
MTMNPFGFRLVTEPSVNLRAVAREALRGRWGTAIGGAILWVILTLVPVMIFTYVIPVESLIFNVGPPPYEDSYQINLVVELYSLVVSGPLTLGFTRFIMNMFRQKDAAPMDVLDGFTRFGKSFALYVVMGIFVFLWTLLLIIPGFIALYRYSMAFQILADNPDIKIMDAIRLSSRMMFGNKWKLFCLNLSFIGWFLLGYLTLGIGLIYVQPYQTSAQVAFYEMICGRLEIQHVAEPGPGPGEGPRLM